jgi:hypothetical protein
MIAINQDGSGIRFRATYNRSFPSSAPRSHVWIRAHRAAVRNLAPGPDPQPGVTTTQPNVLYVVDQDGPLLAVDVTSRPRCAAGCRGEPAGSPGESAAASAVAPRRAARSDGARHEACCSPGSAGAQDARVPAPHRPTGHRPLHSAGGTPLLRACTADSGSLIRHACAVVSRATRGAPDCVDPYPNDDHHLAWGSSVPPCRL